MSLSSSSKISSNPTRPQPSNPSKALSQYQRARSYGALYTTNMAEAQGKDVGNNAGLTTSTEKLMGAREEAFSGRRNRSSSRNGNGRVEKRIEATMANAEPASTARSRKSSHILGLFKENTASQEQKRSYEKTRTSPGLVKSNESSDPQLEEAVRPGGRPELAASTVGSSGDNDAITDGEEPPTKDNESLQKDPPLSEDLNQRRPERKSSEGPAASKHLADVTNTPLDQDRSLEDDIVDRSKIVPHRFDDRSDGCLPIRLLEEIRNYQNITAPLKDKFKSKSPDSGVDIEHVTPKNKEAPLEKFRGTASDVGEEEDESDKEQISSALYYPHQAPSPEPLQDASIESLDGFEDPPQGLESLQSEATSATTDDDDAPSQDVDIALQSHNESRYLHGDLQKAQMPSEDGGANPFERGTSSASESDYDSLDETARSMNGDDSSATDDAETTPKATPKARSPFLRGKPLRDHRVPAAPLGAVELKPYNHQVGGHTTVFRFSKRAVCKQLSNRENEFYEVVERRHPELLRFLPRYDRPFLYSSPCKTEI